MQSYNPFTIVAWFSFFFFTTKFAISKKWYVISPPTPALTPILILLNVYQKYYNSILFIIHLTAMIPETKRKVWQTFRQTWPYLYEWKRLRSQYLHRRISAMRRWTRWRSTARVRCRTAEKQGRPWAVTKPSTTSTSVSPHVFSQCQSLYYLMSSVLPKVIKGCCGMRVCLLLVPQTYKNFYEYGILNMR